MIGEVRTFERDGTPVAVLTEATVSAMQLELGALPSAQLTVPATSPSLVDGTAAIAPGLLLEFTTSAGHVSLWYITPGPPRDYIAEGQAVAGPHVRNLVGGAAMLSRATVDAEGGMSEDAATMRPFGPARAGYDDSEWGNAVEAGSRRNPAFARDPSHPEGWAVTDRAKYIHPVSDGAEGVDVLPGRGHLRTEFTLTVDTELTLQYTADDEVPEIWVAGRQLDEISGLHQWRRTWTNTLILPAGTYAIYVVVNNIERVNPSDNVAHFLFGSVDEYGVEVLRSTFAWRAWPQYPALITPGETAGIIVEVLVGEGKVRGSIPAGLETDFTAVADSGGIDWSHETSWAWPVRHTSVLDVTRDLQRICSIEHVDVVLGDDGAPQLRMFQIYGVDRSVGDAPVRLGPGVITARFEEPTDGANDLWFLTQSGWSHPDPDAAAIAAVGLIEGGDTIGVATIPESVSNAAPEVQSSDVSLSPRVELTVADTDQAAFGRHYDLGDVVLVPTPDGDEPGRVVKAAPVDDAPDPRWALVVEISW